MQKKYEIWLAEDNPDDLALFKEVLLSCSQDFVLLHFNNGLELWEKLNLRKKKFDKKLPDLIVLDQFMPKKSGWEILEMIKVDPELKNIVVLIMSGTMSNSNVENGNRMGMDGFIQKPVFIGEWKAIIEKLILTWKPDDTE
jgi:CheY-like chemotaxis protein